MTDKYTDIDSKFYQESQVIMLPTDKNASFFTSKHYINIAQKGDNKVDNPHWQGQHLYFLSDEEIKEGDWYYSGNKVIQCIKIHHIKGIAGYKKIIATTDDLYFGPYNKKLNRPTYVLPRPSNAFITKFIEEYKKGNKIEKVLIEFQRYHGINTSIAEVNAVTGDNSMNWKGRDDLRDYRLKVQLDHTIVIKPLMVKNSWNREEVIQACHDFYTKCVQAKEQKKPFDSAEYFEQNL